jgi:hypothetical protein
MLRTTFALALAVGLGALAQIPQPRDVPAGFSADISATWANVKPGPNGKWVGVKSADTYGYEDITKGGKTTASCDHFPNEGHANLFDDTPAKWCAKAAKITATYEMSKKLASQAPVAYALTSANDYPGRDPKDWRLLGSNDGKAWTELDAQKNQAFLGRHFTRLFKIAQPQAFALYRFEVLANHGEKGTQIEELQLLVPGKPDPKLTKADVAALKALAAKPEGYQPLFAADLGNAIVKKDGWEYSDGVLAVKEGGDIWTKDLYGDFILDLDFKCAEHTNSGVFLRCASIQDWLNTAIEVQILQVDEKNARHNCGGIFDIEAPAKRAVLPPGQWNHYTIIAKANRILVWLNGVPVTDLDLNRWTTAGRNPDGSKNKFKYAYRALAREGHIGLQYHGHPVTFRNLRIKPLR